MTASTDFAWCWARFDHHNHIGSELPLERICVMLQTPLVYDFRWEVDAELLLLLKIKNYLAQAERYLSLRFKAHYGLLPERA